MNSMLTEKSRYKLSLSAIRDVVSCVQQAPKVNAFFIRTSGDDCADIKTYELAFKLAGNKYPLWIGGHSLAIHTADQKNHSVKRWLSRTDSQSSNTAGVILLDAAQLYSIH